jgi:hypothetical protein
MTISYYFHSLPLPSSMADNAHLVDIGLAIGTGKLPEIGSLCLSGAG